MCSNEVAEKVSVLDKLFKKLKISKIFIDTEIYRITRYKEQKLI